MAGRRSSFRPSRMGCNDRLPKWHDLESASSGNGWPVSSRAHRRKTRRRDGGVGIRARPRFTISDTAHPSGCSFLVRRFWRSSAVAIPRSVGPAVSGTFQRTKGPDHGRHNALRYLFPSPRRRFPFFDGPHLVLEVLAWCARAGNAAAGIGGREGGDCGLAATTPTWTTGASLAWSQVMSAPTTTRPSLRKAINGMCRECIYDSSPGNGTWREQTEGCTSPKCPLYPLRPLTTAGTEARARLWAEQGQDGPIALKEGALDTAEARGGQEAANAVCAPSGSAILDAGSDAHG